MCQCIVGIVRKDGIHGQHLDPAKIKWPFHFLLQNSDLSRSLESMGGSPRTHPLVQLAPGLCLVEQGVVAHTFSLGDRGRQI